MSIPKQMNVTCSKCGHTISTTIFESVNTDYAEDIATQIISGKLFEVECSNCHHLINLEYDMLYNDMKHGAMIWVIHKNSPDYLSHVSEVRSAPKLPYKTLRIVEDMNSLKEKVSCLECNRDDRIIEFCKAFAMGHLLNEEPNFDFDKAFYTCNDGRERIILFDKNGDFRSCDFTEAVEDTYKEMSDLYFHSSYPSKFNENYPIVDSIWSEEVMMALLAPEIERNDAKTEIAGSNDESTKDRVGIICPTCKHVLPKDSEFCQYCGNKLDSIPTGNIKEGIKEPTNYIQKPDVKQPSSKPKKKEKNKTKFCKHCGSVIDNKTKICTGCRKNYFKGIKFKDLSIKGLLLTLVITSSLTLNVCQFINAQTLQSEFSDLEELVSSNRETITQLRNELDKVNAQKKAQDFLYKYKLNFFDEYAALLNENSTKYHTYDCEDFDKNSTFWIYNTNAAEQHGYSACPKCH